MNLPHITVDFMAALEKSRHVPYTEIDEIEIDYIEIFGPYDKVISIGATMRDILAKVAEEEFAE